MAAVELAPPMIVKERLACATLDFPDAMILILPKAELFVAPVNG